MSMKLQDVEERLLSFCLKNKGTMLTLHNANVTAQYFSIPDNQLLFEIGFQYFVRFKEVLSRLALEEALLRNKVLPMPYLLIYDRVVKTENLQDSEIPFLLDELWNKQVGKALPDLLRPVVELSDKQKFVEALESLKEGVRKIEGRGRKLDSQEFDIRDSADVYQKLYDDKVANPESYEGIPFGWDRIDKVTGGMKRQETVLWMGETGSGKTMLLVNLAKNVFQHGANVLYFTIEIPEKVVSLRLHAASTGLEYRAIRDGTLTDAGKKDYFEFLESLRGRKNSMIVCDVPRGCTPEYIESKIIQYKAMGQVDTVFIDYLQLMRTSSKGFDKGHEILNDISKSLHEIGRMHNVSIHTASQVNREGAKNAREEGKDTFQMTDAAGSWDMLSHYDMIFSLKAKVSDEAAFVTYRDIKVNSLKVRDNPPVWWTFRMFPSKMSMLEFDDDGDRKPPSQG